MSSEKTAAEQHRHHSDLNVLCLGAAILGEEPIRRIVETWLDTPFDGGRHARRVKKIARLERGIGRAV